MKWTVWHSTVIALLGLAFVAITVVKHGPTATSPAATDATASGAERAHTESFWDTYQRATRHRTAGRTDSAAAAYRAALQLRPAHHDALYYLGHMQYTQGRLAAADSTWRRLVEVNPESARAYTQLGEVHFCFPDHSLFDLERARTAYRKALTIHNEETRPLLRLGTIALVEDDASARRHLEAVRGSNANNPAADLLVGYLAWRDGNSARATVLRRKAQRKLNAADVSRSPSCPLAARFTAPLHTESSSSASGLDAYSRIDALLDRVQPSE